MRPWLKLSWTGGHTDPEANVAYEIDPGTDPNRSYWTNTTYHFAAALNFTIGQPWFPQYVIPALVIIVDDHRDAGRVVGQLNVS